MKQLLQYIPLLQQIHAVDYSPLHSKERQVLELSNALETVDGDKDDLTLFGKNLPGLCKTFVFYKLNVLVIYGVLVMHYYLDIGICN